jgi:hypothetical protein
MRLDALCAHAYAHPYLMPYDDCSWQTEADEVPSKGNYTGGEHDGRAEPHQLVHLNLPLRLQGAEAHDALETGLLVHSGPDVG